MAKAQAQEQEKTTPVTPATGKDNAVAAAATAAMPQILAAAEAAAEKKAVAVLANQRLGLLDVVGRHAVRHLMAPGFGNKAEGVWGVGTRATATGFGGYWVYRFGVWAYEKLAG